MLLYNQRKEFVGIDEDDLSSLDFQNINELQSESHDFADLFVKKPGYIHNFKNFSWIDFILHSESDESKAIIHAKGRNYSCSLHITPFHFTAEESGYAVVIKNLRVLKGAEDAQALKDLEASGGIQASPAPIAVQSSTPKVATPAPVTSNTNMPELDISLDDIQVSEEVSESFTEAPSDIDSDLNTAASEFELPNFEESYTQELSEPDPLDIPEPPEIDFDLGTATENEFGAPVNIDFDAPLDVDDVMQDSFDEPTEEAPALEDSLALDEPAREEAPMLGDYVSAEGSEHLSDLIKSGDYQYDPSVAANELGLPVDLIEEFIGDFIEQAHEFHDDLYASVNGGDFDNVQILSHKLKGVAANLRVEDAFDVLSVVNVSKDVEEITPNLNQFYKIIAKLEGKEIPESIPAAATPAEVAPEPIEEVEVPVVEEDEYNIGIKTPDDGPMLIDEDVAVSPQDDIYDDLLSSSDEMMDTELSVPSSLEEDDDDDLYNDLLGTSEDFEPSYEESENTLDGIDETTEDEDDIYDDLLGAPQNDTFSEPESSSEVEVAKINFDVQRSANELGIPVDIVKEFVQDFKEQVNVHKSDFTDALDNQDIKEINATATLLKGMSDNLRLNEISEVLKELQAEKDIKNTAQALAKLQAYADQL